MDLSKDLYVVNINNSVSLTPYRQTGGHGNQCCYNETGRIIVGPPGGGTVDRVAPGRSVKDHFYEDVLPFIWCCKGDFPNCATYYRYRPSDDGSRYNPPPPGECVSSNGLT